MLKWYTVRPFNTNKRKHVLNAILGCWYDIKFVIWSVEKSDLSLFLCERVGMLFDVYNDT